MQKITRNLLAGSLLWASVSVTSPVLAAPEGGEVTSGSATIQQTLGTTTIRQLTDRAIVNWRSFGVGSNELVRFIQPSELSAILNRVTGGDPSLILGKLQANGQVFLVNPNGIVFGPGSQVDVGSLMATTMSITDQSFLSGDYVWVQDPNSLVSVVNQGVINSDGFVILNAPSVRNEGQIMGHDVELRGGDVFVDGQVSAGTIVVYADQNATVSGNLTSPGGFIETSSAHDITLTGTIDAGEGGTWLIDPENLTIVSGAVGPNEIAASTINSSLNAGTNVSLTATVPGVGLGSITQNAGATISKTAGASATLTMTTGTSSGSIVLNDSIVSTSGNLNVNLVAGSASGNVFFASNSNVNTNGGTFTATGGGTFNALGSSLTTGAGAVNLNFGGQLVLGSITSGDLTLTSATSQLIQGVGTTLHVATLAVNTPGDDVVTNNGNLIDVLSVSGGGDFTLREQDGFTVGPVSIGAADVLDLTAVTGNILFANTANAGVVHILASGGAITSNNASTDIVSQGNVSLEAASGIGAVGNEIQIVQSPSTTLSLKTNNAGAASRVQQNSDLGGLVVTTKNGPVSLTDIPGGPVSGETLSFSGGLLNVTTNANTNVTFQQTGGNVTLDTLTVPNGLVSIDASGGILDDSNDSTRLTAGTASLTAFSIGATGNTVDLQVNDLIAQATGGGILATDYTGNLNLVANANNHNVNVDAAGGDLAVQAVNVGTGTATLIASGAITNTQDGFADVNSNNTLLTAGTSIALENNSTNLSATAGGNITIDNLVSTNTAANSLVSSGGNIDFEQFSPSFAVLNLKNASASGTLAAKNNNGNLTVGIVTATGDINLTTVLGSMRINSAITPSNIVVVADGNLTEANSPDTAADLVGATIDLQVQSGIGSGSGPSADPFEIDTDSLTVNSLNGGEVNLLNLTGDLFVSSATSVGAILGDLQITNQAGNLTVLSATGNHSVHLETLTSGDVLIDSATAGYAVELTSAGKVEEYNPDSEADILSDVALLSSASGVGSLNPLELDVTHFVNAYVSGNGKIDLVGLGHLDVSQMSTNNGLINLTVPNGNLLAESVTAGGVGRNVLLTTTGSGNITFYNIQAVGDQVQVNSAGSIEEEHEDTVTNVVASTVRLTAATTIGASDPVEIDGATLISNAGGNLRVQDVASGITAQNVSSNSGSIELGADGGNLTLTNVNSVAGNVTLTSSSSIFSQVVHALTGTITATAGGSIEEFTQDAIQNFRATSVTLTAGTGIGTLGQVEVGTPLLNATSTANNVVLGNLATVASQATLATGTGNLALNQTGNQILTVNNATTTNGGITISNTKADLVVQAANAQGAVLGDVTLSTVGAAGNVQLGNVTAADTATVTSVGSILESGADPGADLRGGILTLTASTGIGNGNTLELNGTNLSGSVSGAGSIDVRDTAGGLLLPSLTTTNGAISVSATYGHLVAVNVTTGGSGLINLTTTGSGDVEVGLVSGAAHAVNITAAGAINEYTPDAAIDLIADNTQLVAVNGIGQSDSLETGANLIIAQVNGIGNIQLTEQAGGASISAVTINGSIDLTSENGDMVVTNANTSGTANINLTTTGTGDIKVANAVAINHDITVDSIGSLLESGSDGAADLTATNLKLTAVTGIGVGNSLDVNSQFIDAIVTGTGILDLSETAGGTTITRAFTTNGNMNLASASGTLIVDLASTQGSGEISLTTTGTGDIRVNLVTASGHLAQANAAGSITESNPDAGADIVASDVVLLSLTGIGFNNAIELSTNTLSATVLGAGPIQLAEVVNGMTVTQVSTTDGIINLSAKNGPLIVNSASAHGTNRSLTLTTTGYGAVRFDNLVATGGITVDAAGSIYESVIDAGVDLTAGGNSVLRANGGTISTNASNALEVSITNGTLSVLATTEISGVSIRINGTVSPSNDLILLTPVPPGSVLFNGVPI